MAQLNSVHHLFARDPLEQLGEVVDVEGQFQRLLLAGEGQGALVHALVGMLEEHPQVGELEEQPDVLVVVVLLEPDHPEGLEEVLAVDDDLARLRQQHLMLRVDIQMLLEKRCLPKS